MVEFKVNGTARTADVPAQMPLLWVLREKLALTGTKFGCGIGACAACTVLLNGKKVKSCMVPVQDAAGADIQTIEGLGSRDHLHPVQQAWLDENVSQCGYCQPGQMMAAVALLADVPAPSDDDIDAALSANLCRCGTYPRIRRAVKRAAELLAASRGQPG